MNFCYISLMSEFALHDRSSLDSKQFPVHVLLETKNKTIPTHVGQLASFPSSFMQAKRKIRSKAIQKGKQESGAYDTYSNKS